MNKRILELALEAGINLTPAQFSGVLEDEVDEFTLEKFAELIVAECVGVVEGGRFLHNQSPTAIFARECSGAIKQHFGVEE